MTTASLTSTALTPRRAYTLLAAIVLVAYAPSYIPMVASLVTHGTAGAPTPTT